MARRCHQTGMALRQSERQPSGDYGFTHDVIAVDSDGCEVFETEALRPSEVDTALEDYPSGEDAPDGVERYEIRER